MPWTYLTQLAVPAAAYWLIDPDAGGRFDVLTSEALGLLLK